MNDIISNIRKNIIVSGGSEVKALANSEWLKSMFDAKQELLSEMNKAKRAASDEAAKPFIELINNIDKQYAMVLQMIGENGEKNG